MLVELVAGLILVVLIAYAVLGGADFGGGLWDLLASGPRRREQREAIAAAMGPVWEANHVWLIFVIVLLFTAFPPAFARLSVDLFVPWHLVLLGIILRGAAFVFRAYGPSKGALARQWGAVFGVASLLTPFVLGMSLGAVSSGGSWLSAASWAVGFLAVLACAYLAAVYLCVETTGPLQEDFRRRAMLAWAAVATVGGALLLLLPRLAPHLWPGFAQPAAWPVILGGLGIGAVALWALATRRFLLARHAAIAQVGAMLLGWGAFLQFPYLVFPDLTLHDAAAPQPVLLFVVVAVAAGLVLLVPSLVFLFRVFKTRLPGVEENA